MSCKYQFWNGTDNIITVTGVVYTPEQWIAKNPWYNVDGAKMVIGTGPINSSPSEEFTRFVRQYISQGLALKYGMTDEDILQAISDFEDNRDSVVSDVVSNQRKVNEIFAKYLVDMNNANSKVIAALQAMYNTSNEEMPFNE